MTILSLREHTRLFRLLIRDRPVKQNSEKASCRIRENIILSSINKTLTQGKSASEFQSSFSLESENMKLCFLWLLCTFIRKYVTLTMFFVEGFHSFWPKKPEKCSKTCLELHPGILAEEVHHVHRKFVTFGRFFTSVSSF